MTDNIDWNVIELTEIYESFDMVLRLLDVILEPINIKALYTQESETPKLKVAAYARVSTEQDEQQSSYEAQVDYYRKYICSNPEWKFVGIYADEGITGTNTKKRDGFNSMINDAKAGKIDKLEFWRVLTCNSTHTSLRGGLRSSATSETSPKSTLLRWRLFLRSTSAMRCKKVKLALS